MKLQINNSDELSCTKARRLAVEILENGLEAADPYPAVLEALKGTKELCRPEDYRNIYVIGFGKAAYRMALACEDFLKGALSAGAIIVPMGSINDAENRLSKIQILQGAHPVPTYRNIASARQLLDTIKDKTGNDLVVCLISGGGSALLTLPANGVDLEGLKVTTKLLMEAGSNITELNTVRKHLSSVAGGQLSRRICPAHCISLILSDVVGNDPSVIASGPTSSDPSSFSDAYRVLEKYRLTDNVALGGVLNHLQRGMAGRIPETPKPGSNVFAKTKNVIIADNMRALLSMKRRAELLGLASTIVTSMLEGESKEVGSMIGRMAKRIKDCDPIQTNLPCAFIFGGETTVTVKEKRGSGGRNQELALSVALRLQGLGEVAFASLGSDGIDGSTLSAGAIVDSSTVPCALSRGLSASTFLKGNDSNTFFKKIGGCLISTGFTGTNMNDLAILILL